MQTETSLFVSFPVGTSLKLQHDRSGEGLIRPTRGAKHFEI